MRVYLIEVSRDGGETWAPYELPFYMPGWDDSARLERANDRLAYLTRSERSAWKFRVGTYVRQE